MKYMMLVCRDPSIELSAEERSTIGAEVEAWVQEMEGRGVRLPHGGELAPVHDATTIRVRGGEAVIANAFLVPEPTMATRLVRAKHTIQHAAIPYRVPPAHLLPERTGGVLAVLYLMFNEGYAASTGDDLVRVDLCEEAIGLAAEPADAGQRRESRPAGPDALALTSCAGSVVTRRLPTRTGSRSGWLGARRSAET